MRARSGFKSWSVDAIGAAVTELARARKAKSEEGGERELQNQEQKAVQTVGNSKESPGKGLTRDSVWSV
ncbi:hypothetical protein RTBOTA2_004710 [Rhodotorula toruloides]|nr:hypothetical protein RTBOTA2_004710 [Rhodotorula toruloides]